MTEKCITVFICDDQAIVRKGIRALLATEPNIRVVGEAENGQEAISQAEELRPDVILMDLEMPIMDGYEATHQIKFRWPLCRVIALTIHTDEAARQKAYQAGVDEFVEKGAPILFLMQAMTDS